MTERAAAPAEEHDTARLEAFSDGIFAIAMTLLVLDLKIPATGGSTPLASELLNEWPFFLAFGTSFMTILVMWINHHNMFNYVRRIDTRMMLLNGSLLFCVVLTPFTASLVSENLLTPNAGTAAEVYSGVLVLLAVVWNLLWRYASTGKRLLGGWVTDAQVKSITKTYYVGPISYLVAFGASFVSGLAAIVIIILVFCFYAITASIAKTTPPS